MLNTDEWKRSVNLTMGACAVGALTAHQEYVCEHCQYEFSALFGLVGCYRGSRERGAHRSAGGAARNSR